jgi:hypothetical protein
MKHIINPGGDVISSTHRKPQQISIVAVPAHLTIEYAGSLRGDYLLDELGETVCGK